MQKDIIFIGIFLTLLLLVFLSFMIGVKSKNEEMHLGLIPNNSLGDESVTRTLSVKDINLKILIAETLSERRKGLSGRAMLPEDTAMLFIFPFPQKVGIWMKDMFFPIDILWVSEDFRIIHIVEYAKPESFPEVFKPNMLARYVIETNAGFVAENGIILGDIVQIL
jgi:uncharacterized membrane protein (UPF0127 family)